jgi:hypothetical protein
LARYEVGTLVPSWSGCKMVQQLLKRIEFPQKIKRTVAVLLIFEHMLKSATPLLSMCSKVVQSVSARDVCTLMFTAELFTMPRCRDKLNVHQR